jgi:hypothetical protein
VVIVVVAVAGQVGPGWAVAAIAVLLVAVVVGSLTAIQRDGVADERVASSTENTDGEE